MQYETGTHLCAVVEEADSAQRFVGREFHERLSLGITTQHAAGNAKLRTVRAFKLGHIFLNGRPCERMQRVAPGDLITVHKSILQTEACTTPEPKLVNDDSEVVQLPVSFLDHYRHVIPDWDLSEAFFKKKQPCSVRVDSTHIVQDLEACGMSSIDWPVLAMVSKWEKATALLHHGEYTGELAQQSLESMLPVHALDVQPGHSVLNLCAAQLCKISQILRCLQGRGLCVANDVSADRARRMYCRVGALGVECAPLLMTVGDPTSVDFSQTFDRVLCDVHCSNDGAIRQKSAPTWSAEAACKHHHLQVQQLRRALRYLRLGGRLVYSTSSLNPVENEDVVREVLADGCAKLIGVDWACRFRPGIFAGMEDCVRVMPTAAAPHTGASFFAVLERTAGDTPQGEIDLAGAGWDSLEDTDEVHSAEEVHAMFGLEQSLPLVRRGRLLLLSVGRCSVRGASVIGFGLPLFRLGSDWQVCNEGAAAVAERSARRRLELAPVEFQSLLRRRVRVLDEHVLHDGPVVVSSGQMAVAASVTQGTLEILTSDSVVARYLQILRGQAANLAAADVFDDMDAAVELADAYTIPVSTGGDDCTQNDECCGNMLVVNGLRYCVPYERWDMSALPDEATDMQLATALSRFVRDPQGHLLDEACWRDACTDGRVQLEERVCLEQFQVQCAAQLQSADAMASRWRLAAAEETVARGTRVKCLGHVHERCVRAELPRVLLGTDRFLVVDKPAGLPSQGNKRGVLNMEGVLASMGHRGLHIAHRLDQPVSGVLILGRSTKQQASFLDEGVQKQKTYVARVRPPLASSPTSCEAALKWDGQRSVLATSGGKAAITQVTALSEPFEDGTQLVECRPVQGRRHQIRAHLALLGSPIANDSLYGGNAAEEDGGTLTAFEDDEQGTLAGAFAAEARPWCPSCAWTQRVLAGLEQRPDVRGGIWLHARRYEVPKFGLDAEAPLPAWAQRARRAGASSG